MSEREAYLRENIVVTNMTSYYGNLLETEEQYDVNGNLIMYSDANIDGYTEYAYDILGNRIVTVGSVKYSSKQKGRVKLIGSARIIPVDCGLQNI